MLFTSADYPLFLVAVFFLYGLARGGSWPGAIGRWSIMVLLGDLVYLLLAKDVDALWDPIGGTIFRWITNPSAPPGADVSDFPPLVQALVGAVVLAGGIAIGARAPIAKAQRFLGGALAVVLAVIGGTVVIGHSTGTLDAVSNHIGSWGHLVYLAALAIAIGASTRDETRHFSRLVVLFLVSCIFYHAWAASMDGAYKYLLALLLGTIVLDYYLALWIADAKRAGTKRLLLIASLVANLGILFVFKYADFFRLDVANPLFGTSFEPLALILPAGISFHTFQSLSYTLDVYRGELVPTRSVLQFATFVLFFPQLVAGPIVRAKELLPQLGALPPFDRDRAADGLFRIMVGLFKKIAIADFLAVALVDRVFENPGHFSSVEVLVGVYAYALQIYLDFSAYSDIAIGSAQLLGFELPENFRTPYRSANLQEFWRRWHISLSSWLRDYLYIALGGSRGSSVATYRNLIATMLLGGLWHGASWTFIVWGALHGLGLAATRYFQRHDGARWRVIATTCGIAVVGAVMHATAIHADVEPWFDFLFMWLYLTPAWSAITAELSRDTDEARPRTIRAPDQPILSPSIQVIPLRARSPSDTLVLALRYAACFGVLIVLLAVRDGAYTGALVSLGCSFGLACVADLVERFALAGPSRFWRRVDQAALARSLLVGLRRGVAVALVFHYVCVAWVFFRATSFDNAFAVFDRVAANETDAPNLISTILLALSAGFASHFFPDRTFAWLRAGFVALPPIVQGAIMAGAALILRELASPHIVPFIYFQF
jgi:D-alanyl-lipoteichoic acid acyltransferase DltB (MBOAT superfamily)